MGYQTDFVGYLHVQPPLNESEILMVNSMRLRREDESNAPQGWSSWEACDRGCCLSYDGGDKANFMAPWLKYVMATYLIPGADVHGQAGFEDFGCNHVLNGMVIGSRRDNRELYAIVVDENEVSVELLWPGVPEWSDYAPLGYQVEIDRFRSWAGEHRLEKTREQAITRRAIRERP
ncbi:MAG: hypothetical protein JWP74_2292 [Marmoricola sp.]|nr:hypothetical protein [Marmoricola sp.]